MFRTLVQYWKLNLLEAMEYRVSFLSQIIFMFISDIFTFGTFYFLYQNFTRLGNISYVDLLTLQSIALISIGYAHVLGGGMLTIGDKISHGRLEGELLLPKNLLARLIASRLDVSAAGDLVFGMLIFFFIPAERIIPILLLSVFSAAIYMSFIVVFQSLSFYFGKSQYATDAALNLILAGGMYPPGIFENSFLKIVYLTVVPVVYAYHIPLKLSFSWDWTLFGILLLASIVFPLISILVFYRGLRRYEGGSVMVTNV